MSRRSPGRPRKNVGVKRAPTPPAALDESGVPYTNPYRTKNPEEITALLAFFNAKKNAYESQVELLREALKPHILGDGLAVYVAYEDRIYAAKPMDWHGIQWIDKKRAIDLGLVMETTKKTVRCGAIGQTELAALTEDEKAVLFEEQEEQWRPLREQARLEVEAAVVVEEPPD